MTPTELRKLLLYGARTEANYNMLPPEAGGIWFSRPSREHIDRARYFMCLRVVLLGLAMIYLYFFHRDIGEAMSLLWVIALYEFAYCKVRKEKNEQDHFLAEERYADRVDEFLHGLYPTW